MKDTKELEKEELILRLRVLNCFMEDKCLSELTEWQIKEGQVHASWEGNDDIADFLKEREDTIETLEMDLKAKDYENIIQHALDLVWAQGAVDYLKAKQLVKDAEVHVVVCTKCGGDGGEELLDMAEHLHEEALEAEEELADD